MARKIRVPKKFEFGHFARSNLGQIGKWGRKIENPIKSFFCLFKDGSAAATRTESAPEPVFAQWPIWQLHVANE
jgi:hypothetical protein